MHGADKLGIHMPYRMFQGSILQNCRAAFLITVPEAPNSASRPSLLCPPRRTCMVSPVASVIWQATVRCQISS